MVLFRVYIFVYQLEILYMLSKKCFVPISVLCCLLSVQVCASTRLFNASPVNTDVAITSLNVKASHEVSLQSVKIYASTKGCSDLAEVGEMHPEKGETYTMDPGLNLLTSDDVVFAEEMFASIATPWKCFREDVTSSTGIQQSVGPLKLTWDAAKHRFNQTTPSSVTIDFE